MSVATYNGVALFGAAAAVMPNPEERGRQTNTYPGVDGVETLDQGSRGATTTIEGLWIFPNEAQMAFLLEAWRGLADGQSRPFVDTLGVIWPQTILGPYRLAGRRSRSPTTGQVFQRFSAKLTHLVLP